MWKKAFTTSSCRIAAETAALVLTQSDASGSMALASHDRMVAYNAASYSQTESLLAVDATLAQADTTAAYTHQIAQINATQLYARTVLGAQRDSALANANSASARMTNAQANWLTEKQTEFNAQAVYQKALDLDLQALRTTQAADLHTYQDAVASQDKTYRLALATDRQQALVQIPGLQKQRDQDWNQAIVAQLNGYKISNPAFFRSLVPQSVTDLRSWNQLGWTLWPVAKWEAEQLQYWAQGWNDVGEDLSKAHEEVLGTIYFFGGRATSMAAGLADIPDSMHDLYLASAQVGDRITAQSGSSLEGTAAGVLYFAGSLCGATQIAEGIMNEDFVSGEAFASQWDRWGTLFGGISAAALTLAAGLAKLGYNPTLWEAAEGSVAADSAAVLESDVEAGKAGGTSGSQGGTPYSRASIEAVLKRRVTPEVIAEELRNGTPIAQATAEEILSNPKLKVSVLEDADFTDAYSKAYSDGGVSDCRGFTVKRVDGTVEIYLRQGNMNVFATAVHEGTHMLDYFAGRRSATTGKFTFEVRAMTNEAEYLLLRNCGNVLALPGELQSAEAITRFCTFHYGPP
jgi:hypothetical protein